MAARHGGGALVSGEDNLADELAEAVTQMAAAMPADKPIFECAEELIGAQVYDPSGERRTIEQALMMMGVAYAGALRIIRQLSDRPTYSLAEVRDGTGWSKDVRFIAIQN